MLVGGGSNSDSLKLFLVSENKKTKIPKVLFWWWVHLLLVVHCSAMTPHGSRVISCCLLLRTIVSFAIKLVLPFIEVDTFL